jgi:hypothetical protein
MNIIIALLRKISTAKNTNFYSKSYRCSCWFVVKNSFMRLSLDRRYLCLTNTQKQNNISKWAE